MYIMTYSLNLLQGTFTIIISNFMRLLSMGKVGVTPSLPIQWKIFRFFVHSLPFAPPFFRMLKSRKLFLYRSRAGGDRSGRAHPDSGQALPGLLGGHLPQHAHLHHHSRWAVCVMSKNIATLLNILWIEFRCKNKKKSSNVFFFL